MIGRLRSALMESYVGAILTAWLFADGVTHAVEVITGPLTVWEGGKFARSVMADSGPVRPSPEPYPWGAALPEVIYAVLVLMIAYGILRWLYYEQPSQQGHPPAEE